MSIMYTERAEVVHPVPSFSGFPGTMMYEKTGQPVAETANMVSSEPNVDVEKGQTPTPSAPPAPAAAAGVPMKMMIMGVVAVVAALGLALGLGLGLGLKKGDEDVKLYEQPATPRRALTYKVFEDCTSLYTSLNMKKPESMITSTAMVPDTWWYPMYEDDYCQFCDCSDGDPSQWYYATDDVMESAAASDSAAGGSADSSAQKTSSDGGAVGDYSETNNQVDDIDEADLVKTDGEYVYILPRNKHELIIATAYPFNDVQIVSRTNLTKYNMRPTEMLLDDNTLLIIGQASLKNTDVNLHLSVTSMQIWNIQQKAQPAIVKALEVEGWYVSARLINNYAYVVVHAWSYLYWGYRSVQKSAAKPSRKLLTSIAYGGGGSVMHRSAPLFRELSPTQAMISNAQAVPVKPIVECGEISYVDGLGENHGFLTVMSISTKDDVGSYKYKVHAGSGHEIYASNNHIYIASSNWNYFGENQGSVDLPEEADGIWTGVVQFELKSAGALEYKRVYTVPGSIINQFAMDEYEDHFRIATTWGQMWADPPTSTSAVTIYDATTGDLTGEVKGMAPGERIYSCRFMGKRAHIVTFRQVDPLFVLDLTPAEPKILGELKIEGFSEYLHPVDTDGNYLIGLGKDADSDGNVKGIKVAIFNVMKPQQPTQDHMIIIGDRGTSTEASYEHKAFLYHPEKKILAFPVEERILTEEQKKQNDQWASGQLNFVGTIIYNVDETAATNQGLVERGRISHVEQSWYDQNAQAEDVWRSPPYSRRVYRQTYMKSNAAGGNQEVLWTFSDRQVRVHDLSNMQQLSAKNLTVPQCYT